MATVGPAELTKGEVYPHDLGFGLDLLHLLAGLMTTAAYTGGD